MLNELIQKILTNTIMVALTHHAIGFLNGYGKRKLIY